MCEAGQRSRSLVGMVEWHIHHVLYEVNLELIHPFLQASMILCLGTGMLCLFHTYLATALELYTNGSRDVTFIAK